MRASVARCVVAADLAADLAADHVADVVAVDQRFGDSGKAGTQYRFARAGLR